MKTPILRIKGKDGKWYSMPAIRGEKGKDGTVSFNDLSEEQKESLKGKDGKDGFGVVVQTTGTSKEAVMSQNVVTALFEATDDKIVEATKKYYLYIAPKTVENSWYSLMINGVDCSTGGASSIELTKGASTTIRDDDGSGTIKLSPTGFGAADAIILMPYETYVIPIVEGDYYLWIDDNY